MIRLRRVGHDEAEALIRGWGVGGLKLAGIRVILDNECPYADRPEARVVICNHPSALDLLWGAAICPPRPLAIGKKELIFVPIINWAWWMLRFRRIDRRDRAAAVASLQDVPRWVRDNRLSLVLAPEGTRSHDGGIGPFKKGPFHIAVAAQAPIYPVVVSGAFELMPRTAWLPRTGAVRIRFLDPIPTAGMGAEQVTRLASDCRERMRGALRDLASLKEGAPA